VVGERAGLRPRRADHAKAGRPLSPYLVPDWSRSWSFEILYFANYGLTWVSEDIGGMV
jgi:hypothetical protein